MHWPEPLPILIPLNCRQCFKNNTRKLTSYRCKRCFDGPPLCPGCFKSYHGAGNLIPKSRLNIHWPEPIPRSIPLNCRQCYKNNLRNESSYMCSGCPNGPPLCPECFESWHK